MKDNRKTKVQLMSEVEELCQRIAELEKLETERKSAEEALREFEEKLHFLLENIPDFVITVDRNHKILMINRGVPGVTVEQAIGTKIYNYVEPSHHEIMRESLEKVFQTEMPEKYEVLGMGPKGPNTAWYETRVSPNKIDDQVISVTLISSDITERKRTEEELIRLSNAVKMSTDSIVISDLDTKIIDVNEATLKMFGTKDKIDLVGKNSFDLIAAEDRKKAFAAKKEVMEKGYTKGREYHIILKNGTKLPVEMNTAIMRHVNGKPIGFVAITRDITERKKVEEQIKASLKEKEVLLREIHHRVKNNLQVISSLLKLQSQYIEDKRYVEMSKESQNRIKSMSLIHEMLYQSKHLSKINFKEYIRTLTNYLFRSCWDSPCKIALKIDSENVYLPVDNAIPCGLIINELVSNSLKHAFPDGKEGEIKIALHSTNEKDIELVVSDTGVGIPKDLDFRNTKSLGLHLVTILAEDQLHGEIKLDRNKGTEFKIKLRGVK